MGKVTNEKQLAGLRIGWARKGSEVPNYRHGMTGTPTYYSWTQMKRRCNDPSHHLYARYAGRGISVCDRWLNSFDAFLLDMGVRPSGKTIDRIDNERGYYPGNCRWATPKEQANNSSGPHMITFNGKTMHVSDWAKETNIPRSALAMRLCHGWPIERALTTPVMSRRESGVLAMASRWNKKEKS